MSKSRRGVHVGFMFMFLLALCLFLIPHVSSKEISFTSLPIAQEDQTGFTIDDKVDYKPIPEPFGRYEFYDSQYLFFQGDLKQKAELTDNTYSCGGEQACEFVMERELLIDAPLIEDFKTERIIYEDDNVTEKERYEAPIRNIQFYVKAEDITIEVPNYEQVCETKTSINGTKYNECQEIQNGYRNESQENWIPYNYEILQAGNYTLKGIGEKKAEWIYDWQVKINGVWTSAWSIWGGAGSSTLNRNLIAYYKLDETTGQAKDSVGNYNSTYLNALQGQPGKINNSYNFSSQNVSLPTLTYLSGNNMSVSAWIKFDTATLGYYKIIGGNPNGFTFSLENNGTQNVLSLGKRGVDIISSNLYITNLTEWNFVSASYNGTDILFKLNNNTQIKTYGSNFSQTNYTIGQKSPDSLTEYFIGKIDELGIWNRSLSITELNDLYSLQLTQNKTYPFLGDSSITLNSPANNLLSSNSTQIFNATANVVGGAYLTNASLFLNGLFNESKSLSSIANDKAVDRANGINNGTLVNGVVLNSSYARWGNGGAGINRSNILSNTLSNNFNFNDASYSFWVKMNQTEIISQSFPSLFTLTNGSSLNSIYIYTLTNLSSTNYGKIIIKQTNSTGGTNERSSTSSYQDNNYHFVSTIINSSYICLYIDNNLQGTCLNKLNSYLSIINPKISVGSFYSTSSGLTNTAFDEVRIFNRSLTQAEITSLYTTNTIADTTGLVAYYDMENYSINNQTTAEVTFEKNISEGNINWSVQACDTDGACGYSENRTLTIDTQSPVINILSPQPNQLIYNPNQNISLNLSITHASSTIDKCWITTSYNVTNTYFNCSKNTSLFYPPTSPLNLTINVYSNDTANNVGNASVIVFKSLILPEINITSPTIENYLYNGKNLSLNYSITTNGTLDTCWYNYNSINTSINCSLSNRTFVYVNGVNTIRVYANDTFNNLNYEENNFSYLVLENSLTYNNQTTEGTLENFYLNLTISSLDITSAVFQYQNISQISQIDSNGNNRIIYITNFEIPQQNSETNVSFYWTITLSNGLVFNTTSKNQTVKSISIDDCSVNTYKLLNISLFDEKLRTPLNGTIELFYDIQNYPSYTSIQSFNGSYSNVNNKLICSNVNFTTSSFVQSAEIRYSADSYAKELYYIQRGSMTNLVNLNLYDLNYSDSTDFLLNYQDKNNIKVSNAVIQLMRKYIAQNTYEIVEAPLTSSEGTAIVHIDLNTNIYKAVVVKNGVVLDVFDNLVFSCESPLSIQCKQNLYGSLDPQNSIPLESLTDFSVSDPIVVNDTMTIIFSIPSGIPSNVNVLLTQKDQFGTSRLCNKTVVSSGGSMQCTFNKTIGDSFLDLAILKDGEQVLTQSYVVPEENGLNFLNNNFFIVFIMLLSVIGMGFSSPEWIILNAVVVLFVSGALWLLNGMNFVVGLGAMVWLLIAAIILIMKISKQEDQ